MIARLVNLSFREKLGIVFDLESGGTFDQVLSELDDGTLRIGIHVQGYSSGGSESFVNVPVPPAIWLLETGLFGLVAGARRRQAAAAGRR